MSNSVIYGEGYQMTGMSDDTGNFKCFISEAKSKPHIAGFTLHLLTMHALTMKMSHSS